MLSLPEEGFGLQGGGSYIYLTKVPASLDTMKASAPCDTPSTGTVMLAVTAGHLWRIKHILERSREGFEVGEAMLLQWQRGYALV